MLSLSFASTSVDAILSARSVIARFGERDAMAWWDDESLMPSGAFVMSRLFPRTVDFSRTELAIEAAALRHQALIPQPARITLFRLPPLLESTVRQRLLSLKREGAEHPIISQVVGIDVRQPLADMLITFGLVSVHDLDAVRELPVTGSTIALGSARAAQIESDSETSEVLRRLIAGYTLGMRGQLAIPFYETLS